MPKVTYRNPQTNERVTKYLGNILEDKRDLMEAVDKRAGELILEHIPMYKQVNLANGFYTGPKARAMKQYITQIRNAVAQVNQDIKNAKTLEELHDISTELNDRGLLKLKELEALQIKIDEDNARKAAKKAEEALIELKRPKTLMEKLKKIKWV